MGSVARDSSAFSGKRGRRSRAAAARRRQELDYFYNPKHPQAQKAVTMVEVATMSKAEAMTTVDTMAKKYLDADAYNGAKNDGTAKALDLVAMLTSVLQTEYETVEKMAKKDRDQSEADRAGEHNAAGARFTGEKKRVECASLAVMQEAKTVMDADMKEADRLIDLDGNYDAALTKQSNGQGQAGPARPGSCKTLVDKLGGDDINYLEDERAAIKELMEILAGMDLGVKHKKTKTFSKAASEFVKWGKCAQKRQTCSSGRRVQGAGVRGVQRGPLLCRDDGEKARRQHLPDVLGRLVRRQK